MNSQNNIVSETLTNLSVSDLEAQITDNSINQNGDMGSVPLKGILRREIPPTSDIDAVIIILKTCSVIFILIIAVPIIVVDLYFGFTDTSCVKTEPDGLDISLKLYLLVSGFFNMGIMLAYIASICLFAEKDDISCSRSMCCAYLTGAIGLLTIWNILGAIVFWGTIYGDKICKKNVSTYIFGSLIIKLIGNLVALLNNRSEKKK
jgi:hypothetical protein